MCQLCVGRDFETEGVGLSAMMRASLPEGAIGESAVFAARVVEAGDQPASLSTGAQMDVDDLFDGRISSPADEDWIGIDLVAGQTYVFSLWGTGGGISGLTDPLLVLRDGAGFELAQNDDVSADNMFAQISHTATQSGRYYLEASAASSSSFVNSGAYRLQAATDIYDVDQVARHLTEIGWGFATPLRFDVQAGDSQTANLAVNLTGLTSTGQGLARQALEVWAGVSGLQFTETDGSADITFDDDQSGAFAGPSSFYTESGLIRSAVVNVSTAWTARYGSQIDSYSFLTYLHEIGHALGLAHAGPYNGSATYGRDNAYQNDSYQMSIMSYFDLAENTAVEGSDYRPATPMIADIAAIQRLYGAGSVFAGDTVWGADGTLEGVWDDIMDLVLTEGRAIGLTIVDSSGQDVIDLSGVSLDQSVDLRAGGLSSVGQGQNNLLIAQGTVIEAVIGGSGDDLLIGNSAGNEMQGGAGQDRLDGLIGNDTLRGGDGDDEILGRAGNDALSGQAGDDTIAASDGHDTVEGGAGDDYIGGGYGNDLLRGNGGNDVIGAGSGRDVIEAGTGHDIASGGWAFDTVYGGAGNDTLAGSYDADQVFGGSGADSIGGGTGNDTIFGGDGADEVGAGLQDDLVYGEGGDDFLAGGDGADRLYGGEGADRLNGGPGDDWLHGGAGADVFVFTEAGSGVDHIADFQDGTDLLRLPGADFAGLDLRSGETEGTTGAELSFGDYTIFLQDIAVAALGADDFLFA